MFVIISTLQGYKSHSHGSERINDCYKLNLIRFQSRPISPKWADSKGLEESFITLKKWPTVAIKNDSKLIENWRKELTKYSASKHI